MAGFEVARLVQNPLGQLAPPGQRDDIVRVSNERATIYLDPMEFEQMGEAGLLRLLSTADTRQVSVAGASTHAGGRALPIHDVAHRPARPQVSSTSAQR